MLSELRSQVVSHICTDLHLVNTLHTAESICLVRKNVQQLPDTNFAYELQSQMNDYRIAWLTTKQPPGNNVFIALAAGCIHMVI